MALILPFRCRRQPPEAVGVDKSNPLSAGLAGFVLPWKTPDTTVVGTPASSKALSSRFETRCHEGDGSSYYEKPVSGLTGKITLLLVSNAARPAGTTGFIGGLGNSGAGNELFGLRSDTTNDTQAVIRVVNGGGFSAAKSGLGTSALLTPVVFVSTWDGTALEIYRNGFFDSASYPSTGASGFSTTFDRLCLGGIDRGTDAIALATQKQALAVAWNRLLSPAEILAVSDNPWQLFGTPSRRLYPITATAAALAGNAADTAAATGALTTAIPIAGAALVVATATGQISTAIPLAGVAAAVVSASGSLTAQITLSGAALSAALATAQLSTSIDLLGSASAQAGASASLTAQIRMSGAAVAQAQASADLAGTGAALAGNAAGSASSTAELTAIIRLDAAAINQAIATGSLTTVIQLAGGASAYASASGTLTGMVPRVSDPRYVVALSMRDNVVRLPERSFMVAINQRDFRVAA